MYRRLLWLLLLSHAAGLNAQENEAGADITRFPEAEFVASTSFRSAAYVQPLWKGLHFESDYFGTDDNDVGFAGASWEFRWSGLRLPPGVGAVFGDNGFRTMPGISLRWAYEKNWFVTEGVIVQGLLETPHLLENTPDAREQGLVRPTITDGDHMSVRWCRLEVGGAWERIHFREIEWEGGGRLAFQILSHLSGVFYVLGPETELRGGLILHPAEEK